jgi:PAS domain S-box-containing protein
LPSATPDRTLPRLSFRLRPDPARLKRARERMRDYLHGHGVALPAINDIVLAIEEAMTNAVRHSGSTDDLEVALHFEGSDLVAHVRDHGRGFAVASFDADKQPDPLQLGGRGLYLISRLMDNLDLRSDGGLELRAVKRGALGEDDRPAVDDQTLALPGDQPYGPSSRVAMLDEIDEGYFALDWEYRYLFVNRAAGLMTGRDASEHPRAAVADLYPQIADVGARAMREAMELGKPSTVEFESLNTGEWRELRAYPTSFGISCFMRDIEARKRKELERDELFDALRGSEDRFRSLFASMTEGVALHEVIYDHGRPIDYRILDVNPSFERHTGVAAQTARGRLATELYGTEEAPYLAEYVRVAEGGGSYSFETYFEPMTRHFRITAVSPSRGRFATVFEDITERKQAEEAMRASELRLQQELETTVLLSEAASSLTQSLALGEVLGKLARVILEVGGHTRVTISLWQEREAGLRVASALGEPIVPIGLQVSLDELSEPARRAIREKRSTLIDYDALEPRQGGVGDRVTSHLALDVPLFFGDRFVGLIAVDDPAERREFSARERRLIEGIGAQAASALEHARLHDELAARERFNAALNEINTLIHSTLKVEEIMQRVVAYAVDVVGADSAMVALKHGDDWVAEYGHPEVPGVIHESVRSDEAPFMITAVEQRLPVAIDDCETDPRCIPEVQRRFGVRSVLCIPLIAHDDVLGVIFFNHHQAAVRFEPHTVDFAGQLAVAISSALENATLFEAQRRIAETLQEIFIHDVPTVAGLELGVVSQTAFEPELVGGDFSDVFIVDDAHVVILIGDVAGKGVHAAGMTETVRSTVRALAAVDCSPDYILAKTNELLLKFDPGEPHVTAFLGVLDPRTGHLSYASAGHPAPIHMGAFSAQPLDVAFGPPLGSFDLHYTRAHAGLTLEDYLVLYTDGVTEARRDRELLGDERLLEIVAGLRGRSAQEVADGVRDATLAFAGHLRDDLQVVVLRLA